MKGKVWAEVERFRDDMVEALGRICRIPAVSPHNGGAGEEEKAREIERLVKELGLGEVRWHRVEDDKSPTGNRPSLFLEVPGKRRRRLCILTHTDIVPEGDRSLWTLDPYQPELRDSRLYGRGVSDNGMTLIASIYALKALAEAGVSPEFSVCLVFAADEEMGSNFGLKPLLDRGLFREDDLVIAPDGGNDAGDFVEVSEKANLKLAFTVTGRQAHASLPHTGLNACRAANILAVEVDEALHKAFPDEDPLFDPPVSTFEPTRRFANVPNTNTVPGKERFEFDCRVLPSVSLDKVLEVVERVRKDVEMQTGASIELKVGRSDAAPPTSPDSDIVKLLCGSIREVLGIEPKLGGIGGGTFAALFRRKGIPAVVWQQECAGVAHQPDEYTEIEYLVNNAKIFAMMMMGGA
ncbi:M20 family metallo-hydrolase [Fretibacterium sp. OH1220_COT-178]|uniref:M20 family metallo-hydrolase n=1 Tax=Fretibacterium sp. OH1220_COT-178 TaxID=2491047 RepID=UPI000F5F800A|nr:M20 family metallo-hydrolase [Fretibacterium sp. OH1220_COT-178]RRD65614.1 M20 family metallo-hydrolase [Fretibacterium sp. OH1220_COT-178]